MILEQCVSKVLMDLLDSENDEVFRKVKSRIESTAVAYHHDLDNREVQDRLEKAYESVRSTLSKI